MKITTQSACFRLETCTPRLVALGLLVVLVLFAVTGCKSEPRTSAGVDPAGVFTITADGRCRSLVNFSVAERGDVGHEVKASYTKRGAELTMQWEGAGTTKGQIKGNQFTMTNEGMVFCYLK